jgi:ribosomal protein L18
VTEKEAEKTELQDSAAKIDLICQGGEIHLKVSGWGDAKEMAVLLVKQIAQNAKEAGVDTEIIDRRGK